MKEKKYLTFFSIMAEHETGELLQESYKRDKGSLSLKQW